ncbi:NUDIX hydrolase [Tenuibacillus multivorans]|uniref:ADP-ribose pyrophosphatase YjhB, NUDIX family n=1 Tax=Tenuibacillus multivorans TaxID=237069 RepID=A0A1H0AY34_9BACI|nr:NUDIX hydrolase [Tenuibacillus multivorans]GEL77623.1 hypothetical protein TMU01_18580 [Tenuibacillus multivorans]SDN38191.1 ADP-ribose pyrophosphatase YjhB, NUDIX family [Tenuibacillus multivorans]
MKRVDVASVLVQDSGKILMVKNVGQPESYYSLPGGAVEAGETLEDAAVREAKEETGLDIQINGLFMCTEALFEESNHHAVFFVFHAHIIGGEMEIFYPEEIEEIKWMDVEEADQYIHKNEGRSLKELIDLGTRAEYVLRGFIPQNE